MNAATTTPADLLELARSAGRSPDRAQLAELGVRVEQYVAATGTDALLALIPPGSERVALAHLDEVPLLALRRYVTGERSSGPVLTPFDRRSLGTERI